MLKPTSITYTSLTGYSDFSSATGWAYANDVGFNIDYAGETAAKLRGTPESCYVCQQRPQGEGGEGTSNICCDPAILGTISKPAGLGEVIARVDFYPDATTLGNPKFLFKDASNSFGVYWYPGDLT